MIRRTETDTLTGHQLTTALTLVSIGIGPYLYPLLLVKVLGRDAWLMALGNTVMVVLLAIAIGSLINNAREKDIVELYTSRIGRLVAGWAVILVSTIAISGLVIMIRVFADVLLLTQLLRTPRWATIGVMTISILYIVLLGSKAVGRVSEVMFLATIPIFALIIIARGISTDFANLLPIGEQLRSEHTRIALLCSFCGYRGVEVLLLLAPAVGRQVNAVKAGYKAVIYAATLVLPTVILPIVIFGPEMMSLSSFPLLDVASTLRFPGGPVERMVFVVIMLWHGLILASGAIQYSASANALSRLLDRISDIKSRPAVVLALAPIIWVLAQSFRNMVAVREAFATWSSLGGTAVAITVALLWAIRWMEVRSRP